MIKWIIIKKSNELIVAMIFILLLVVTAIYFIGVSEYEKLFRIALTFITIVGVYLLYIKSFLKGSKIIYYKILIINKLHYGL